MPPPEFSSFASWDDFIIWFLRRSTYTDPQWRALATSAHARSWWMAQITQLDLVNSVFRDTARAIHRGIGFKQWQKLVGPKLRRAWGKGARDAAGRRFNQGARMQLIWRNAAQSTYSEGRWHQMRDPAVMAALPYWLYDATLDSRTSPLCRSLDGTIKRADDVWWETHYPPLHHNCRSGVIPITEKRAGRMGGPRDPKLGHPQPDPGWGLPPGKREQPMPGQVAPGLGLEHENKKRATPTFAQMALMMALYDAAKRQDREERRQVRRSEKTAA